MFSHSYVVAANHAKLERLARMPGVELSLICPRRIRREFGVYPVQRTHHSDYQIVPLRAIYASHNYRFLYLGAARALRRLAPDLLHIEEEPWSLAAWQAVRYTRRQRARIGALTPALSQRERGLKVVVFTWQNLRQRHGFPHGRLERAVLAAADAAIAGNADAAEILREKGFARPVHVLPQFGVDESVYVKRDERALRQELGLRGFVVGFAGRLVHEKGVTLLAEAVSHLAGDWSLLVAGGGPLRQELARRFAQPPLAGRAVLLDTLPHAEMPRYLNCMDALVLPSRGATHWKEQFGHVLIEAMACEVPVIGSTCGEIPHVIADAGLTFPEGDAASLTDALRRLMASPEMRSDLAARGRQRVLNCYTDARIAQATFDIWREVLSR
ncbi:MAG: glycosyltransferase family 4 protein [Planctomycetes bacterium]|nr:glycosyltransferase family 4 protein [Planctomycetota bacterium]